MLTPPRGGSDGALEGHRGGAAGPPPPAENWLRRLLRGAIERNWCLDPRCTTCGADRFRAALRAEAAAALGRMPSDRRDRAGAQRAAGLAERAADRGTLWSLYVGAWPETWDAEAEARLLVIVGARFPASTVLRAEGMFAGASCPTRVVQVATPDRSAIEALAAELAQAFGQQWVGLVDAGSRRSLPAAAAG